MGDYYYYDDMELAYDSPVDSSDEGYHVGDRRLSAEEWQDWNSEDLLNLWMSIVQYHEEWYLPLRQTFNQFCDFVYRGEEEEQQEDREVVPEIQAIQNHPFIKGLDWSYFFSLGTK
jgi:hypothetical protein